MKIKLISILAITMLFSSCSSWIDSSINTDPNYPTDVPMTLLTGPIEANLGYVVGGDLARTGCLWMQQIAGLQSQSADYDVYSISEADVNNSWSFNLYSPGMINAKILMDKAVTQKSPAYGGVAKILMAYYLGVTTDMWGDIPYSDALKGASGQTKSKYDSQQQIYTTIFSLLNGAITDLNAPSATSPGADDLIYGGDLTKWTKTAYALKARYSLHLAKQNGATAYTDALTAIANAYTSNADDFKMVFGAAESNSNPMFQFTQQRKAYVGANSTYQSLLSATNDPRQAVYFTGTVGSPSGSAANLNASGIGVNYASAASPVYLMSFAEVKFIEAEASLLQATPDVPRAILAYNAGLKASLDREGITNAVWLAANQIPTGGTITLQKIINQKYLSSFLQIEVWTDWRRTGFPTLSLATGALTSQIPRRLPYPSDERLYNGSNEPSPLPLITDRVWWDKQ